MSDSTATTSTRPELDENITREFLKDDRIVAFTIASITRDTLDKWAAAAAYELENWADELPFLNLQDFTTCKNFSFSPYLRAKSEEITVPRPDKIGRTAVVIPRSISAQIVRVFLLAKKNRLRQRQVFFNREDGIKWLEEWLDLSKVPDVKA